MRRIGLARNYATPETDEMKRFFYEGGGQETDVFELCERMEFERDYMIRNNNTLRGDFDAVASEACQLQDALGFPCETENAQEKAMERLRDLIAAEGELGDAKEKIEKLEAECMRLHDHWHNAEEAKQRAAKILRRFVPYGDMVAEDHPSAVSYNGQCARAEGGFWRGVI